MTNQADIDAIAAAVAERLGLGHAPLPSPTRSPERRPVVSMKGVEKHGKTYRITRQIGGHRIRQGGFATAAEAALWADRLERSPEALATHLRDHADRRASKGGASVNKCLATYLDGPAGQLPSARLMLRYQTVIGCSRLGAMTADAVRQDDVDRYARERVADGVSAKTVWNELGFLRAALRYAWRCDRIMLPPKFQLEKPRSSRRRVYSDSEIGRLLTMADPPLRRALLALVSTGMRRGELCAARWDWVRELRLGDETRHILELPGEVTKTGTARTVPLGAELWKMLQEEPRHPEALFARWRRGRNGGEEPSPSPWHSYALWEQFKDVAARAGCGDGWLHDFRRSMATQASEADVSEAVVQALGGWASPAALRSSYTHARVGATGALVERLESKAMAAAGAARSG